MKTFLFLILSLFAVPLITAESADRNMSSAEFYVPAATLSSLHQKPQPPQLQAQQNAYEQYLKQSNFKPAANSRSFAPNTEQRQTMQNYYPRFRQAPINDILAKQSLPKSELDKYQKHIVRSYYILPRDLKKMLQNELTEINNETKQIMQIKSNWEKQSPAYKFINYQLNTQIKSDIVGSRKNYKRRQKAFADFLQTAPEDKYVSIIEATDPLFWMLTLAQTGNKFSSFSHMGYNLHYISVFDHEYRHVFTYHRLHTDANRNRRIVAVDSQDKNINAQFQKLFNDYNTDLRRIGTGLDMTNPTLLRQIGEMKDKYITKTY